MDITTESARIPVQMEINPIELGIAPDLFGLDSESVSHETYDEVAINLSGRETSDLDDDRLLTPPSKILRCKTVHNFSTFNARTLLPAGRVEELLFCCQQYSKEIHAIQDHRCLPMKIIKPPCLAILLHAGKTLLMPQ